MMHRTLRAVAAALVALTLIAVVPRAMADELDDARALVREGDYDGAQGNLDVYLARAPNDPQARFLKGVVLAEQERVDEAIEIFSELTDDFPALPEPYNNLAVLYAARGDYERARDALLVAISTHPSYATAHENLGDIYAKMAGLAYDKALKLDDANTTARAKLELLHDLLSERGAVAAVAAGPASTGPAASRPITTAARIAEPSPGVGEPPLVAASTSTQVSSGTTEILATLTNWAKAWSAQDVDRYLDFYAPRFQPADGRPRSRWEQLRRLRLTKPRFIEVSLSDTRVERPRDTSAAVTFTQNYRSESYQDQVRKQVELVWAGNEWKIISEFALP